MWKRAAIVLAATVVGVVLGVVALFVSFPSEEADLLSRILSSEALMFGLAFIAPASYLIWSLWRRAWREVLIAVMLAAIALFMLGMFAILSSLGIPLE